MEKDCGAWINLLSHKVKARLDAAFQDLGITGVQSWIICYILKHYPDGPVFQRDIESAFGLSRSTATGILQLLERNGIILKESVANDARLKSLIPTQRAVELDASVHACLAETDRQLTKGLSDVQVIGVPDEQYGEEIMACVILKEGETMTEDEMKKYVRDHMAKHKVPRYVDFVDAFPMNAAGKILKYKMREDAVKKLGLQKAEAIETA